MSTAPEAFLDELARELRLRGCPVLRSELLGWLAAVWVRAVAEGAPSPSAWATRFLESPAGQRAFAAGPD
jgi:hypothetical protein